MPEGFARNLSNVAKLIAHMKEDSASQQDMPSICKPIPEFLPTLCCFQNTP